MAARSVDIGRPRDARRQAQLRVQCRIRRAIQAVVPEARQLRDDLRHVTQALAHDRRRPLRDRQPGQARRRPAAQANPRGDLGLMEPSRDGRLC